MMTEPIRVAQVMGYMNGGGVEAVVMNYYRHIDREIIQFDFIVCDGSTLVPKDEIERLGGRVFMVSNYKNLARYQRDLMHLYKKERWRIVHSHMNSLSVFPLRAAKKVGIPVRIAHSHSTSGRDEYFKNTVKFVLKKFSNVYPTDRFACGSRAGDWLFGKNSNYDVVPNAIDMSEFSRNDEKRLRLRRELGIAQEALVVGHVGRFMRQKNHIFLLHIFREVLERRKKSILLLIGSGPLFDEILAMAERMGLRDNVLTLGQRGDIGELYNVFDVFCMPSLYEGLPVVSVECQAAGVPMVLSTAVSEEACLSNLIKFEDLASAPSEWADDILSFAGQVSIPTAKISEYDINIAAGHLAARYQDLYRDSLAECKK